MPSLAASRVNTPSNLNPNATKQTKIAVYCGSSPGHDPAHMEMARDLARVMAENNIGLGMPFSLISLTRPSLTNPPSVRRRHSRPHG